MTTIVILAALASIALAGWVMAELELRDAHRDLAAAEEDLTVALGWHERRTHDDAVVHTTLHLIEGGEQ